MTITTTATNKERTKALLCIVHPAVTTVAVVGLLTDSTFGHIISSVEAQTRKCKGIEVQKFGNTEVSKCRCVQVYKYRL